jgi:hypothetical protein
MSEARRHLLLVLGVTVVGAALRFRGLDWGLPWALHIDERLFVVAKAIRLERALDGGGAPDAGISSYGILPLWLLVAARKLFLGAASAPGPPAHGDEFAGTVLLARWISALWGTAAIVLTALWARRWGARTAVLAAALTAGFPALVQASHFGTVEAPLVALLAGGMLAAERLAERPGLPRAAAAGSVLGLAVSVKAPGAVLALPMLHAAWGGPVHRLRRAVTVLAAAAAVALVLNPGLLAGGGAGGPDRGEHTTLGGNLRRAYSSDFHDWTLPYAHDVPGWTEATRLLPYAMGVLPEILAVAGLLILLRRRDPRDVRLLLVLLPVLLVLLPANVKTVRFLLPALPALAVCAAAAVAALGARAPRWGAGVAAAAGALTLLHGAAFSSIYAGTDARVAAAYWLDENVTGREIVAVEDPPGYGPPLGSPSREIRRPDLRYELLWRDFYTGHERASEAERRRHLDAVLRRSTWLALSEGHRAEFTAAPELRPVESELYRRLDAGELPFRKVAEFKSYPRLGPLVLRDDGAEVLMRVFDHPRVEIWKRVDE